MDLGLTWIEWLWFPQGAHLILLTVVLSMPNQDLVILFPIWASLSPGDFVPHLDLIAVDSFMASPGPGDSDPICLSPRPGDSGPHLGIIGTW